MSDKKKKGLFDKIKDKTEETVDKAQQEYNKQKKKMDDFKTNTSETVKKRAKDTSSPEKMYYNTWSWFWMILIGTFVALSGLVIGLSDTRFLLVGILLILALPVWIIWCLLHMIPEIKIFGFTIFSRKNLSLRRQLSVSKEIFRVFSRTFIENNPEIAFIISIYFFILIAAILFAIIG